MPQAPYTNLCSMLASRLLMPSSCSLPTSRTHPWAPSTRCLTREVRVLNNNVKHGAAIFAAVSHAMFV